MSEEKEMHGLNSMPPPESPDAGKGKKATRSMKKTFAIVFGAIGVIASTSTVVGLFRGWFDSEPTAEELAAESAARLEEIDKKLQSDEEDTHLVNQVSRRVTELSDQFKRIRVRMKDIGRLQSSLDKQPGAGKIMTPEQERMLQASRKKEKEELMALLEETKGMVTAFIESVEDDDTLSKVSSSESTSARTKLKAVKQAQQARKEILPELEILIDKYGD